MINVCEERWWWKWENGFKKSLTKKIDIFKIMNIHKHLSCPTSMGSSKIERFNIWNKSYFHRHKNLFPYYDTEVDLVKIWKDLNQKKNVYTSGDDVWSFIHVKILSSWRNLKKSKCLSIFPKHFFIQFILSMFYQSLFLPSLNHFDLFDP